MKAGERGSVASASAAVPEEATPPDPSWRKCAAPSVYSLGAGADDGAPGVGRGAPGMASRAGAAVGATSGARPPAARPAWTGLGAGA
eukprot:410229-Alexandrium_andersonii.AAC.1